MGAACFGRVDILRALIYIHDAETHLKMHGDIWNLRDLTNYTSSCKLYVTLIYIYIYIYIYMCVCVCVCVRAVDHLSKTTGRTQ